MIIIIISTTFARCIKMESLFWSHISPTWYYFLQKYTLLSVQYTYHNTFCYQYVFILIIPIIKSYNNITSLCTPSYTQQQYFYEDDTLSYKYNFNFAFVYSNTWAGWTSGILNILLKIRQPPLFNISNNFGRIFINPSGTR